jgi:hypothetical protein
LDVSNAAGISNISKFKTQFFAAESQIGAGHGLTLAVLWGSCIKAPSGRADQVPRKRQLSI